MPELAMVDKEILLPLCQTLISDLPYESYLYARYGDFDAAIKTAKSIQMYDDSSRALANIAAIQMQVDREAAKKTLDAAIQAAKRIDYDYSDRSQALANIAGIQIQVDNEAAKKTLDAAIYSRTGRVEHRPIPGCGQAFQLASLLPTFHIY
jgi:hypothetical protein